MKLTKLAFTVLFVVFLGFSLNAQDEEGVISTINDYSIKEVEYNPNGIKMLALDNTLMLEFDKDVKFLKYEVINMKGHLLLARRDVDVRRSQLNITDLEKGTYFVRIYSDDLKDFLRFSKN